MNAFDLSRAIVPPNYVIEASTPSVLRIDILRTMPNGTRCAYAVAVDLNIVAGKVARTEAAIRQAYVAMLACFGWDEEKISELTTP